jgi:hypothetical protein
VSKHLISSQAFCWKVLHFAALSITFTASTAAQSTQIQ